MKLVKEWKEYRIATDASIDQSHVLTEFSKIWAEQKDTNLEGIAMSSVVPELTGLIRKIAKQVFGHFPLLIEPKWYKFIPVTPVRSSEIGTDLLSNALAAFNLLGPNSLVVDFGTALTFTYINRDGIIDGVSIAPGIKTSLNALVSHAAKLPEISLELPSHYLGHTTLEAMRSGVLWGFIGQVKYMLENIKHEKGDDMKSLATGGLSGILHPLFDQFDLIDRQLTIKGLYEFFMIASKVPDARDAD